MKKLGLLPVMVVAVVLATASGAFASTPTAALEAGAESLRDTLIAVAVVVIPIAATVAAIPLGWRWVRKFVK